MNGGTWERWAWGCGRATDLGGGGGLASSHRDAEDGVGTEVTLVRGTVELEQEVVESLLVDRVQAGLDHLGGGGEWRGFNNTRKIQFMLPQFVWFCLLVTAVQSRAGGAERMNPPPHTHTPTPACNHTSCACATG